MDARPVAVTLPAPAGERGFNLLEVLVAMTLLAFVLVSTGSMLLLAARANAAARDLTLATTLAHDRAEALKRAHYATLSSGQDQVVVRGITFDRSWVLEDGVPYPNQRRLTVTVTPRRRAGHGGSRPAVVRFQRVPV